MLKKPAVTYKVFLFERVKKKALFLNTETYPLQIRLTAGTKTIYIKSYFFSLLRLKKYQQEMQKKDAPYRLQEIARLEDELIAYLLIQKTNGSLPGLRHQYVHFSYDLLHHLDESFKQFLVDFFYTEQLPAYAMFIKNDGANHRAEFILSNLEQSLQPVVFKKLLTRAAASAPPYIPLACFFQKMIKDSLPVLPVYRWKKDSLAIAFSLFTRQYFPEYKAVAPAEYIQQLIEKTAFIG